MNNKELRTGRFRRAERLLDSRDYRRVMRTGRRMAHWDMTLFVAPLEEKRILNGDLGAGRGSRLGITASRKVGNAVCRNRFKRRVREWFRHRRGEFGGDFELLVIARKSVARLSMAELDQRLCKLLGLIQAPH